ncbi:MAG: cytochrome c oxidase subunit II [Bernardetiaceae bacterium]
MVALLGGVALILITVLFTLIYRVFTLVEISKRKELGVTPEDGEVTTESGNRMHALLFIAFFFVGFGLFAWYSASASDKYVLPIASVHGESIDYLFWITTAVVVFVFVLTHVLLFFFPMIYSFKKDKRAHFYAHNNRLELVWTVIPAIVLTLLVVGGWRVWSDITAPAPEEAVQVEIMGKQFNWQMRYGGADNKVGRHDFRQIDATNSMGIDFVNDLATNKDDFTTNTLMLPKGRDVLLKIWSRDVLHSVFLPHFRVKMDAVPGMPTQFWFRPTKTTEEMRAELKAKGDPNWEKFEYRLNCTEICGTSHFAMAARVVVVTEDEYEAWVKDQEPWADKNKDYLAEKGIILPDMALND